MYKLIEIKIIVRNFWRCMFVRQTEPAQVDDGTKDTYVAFLITLEE